MATTRDLVIPIRVKESERRLLDEGAEIADKPLSTYIRDAAIWRAGKDVARAAKERK